MRSYRVRCPSPGDGWLPGRRWIRRRQAVVTLPARQGHHAHPILTWSEHDRPGRANPVHVTLGIHYQQDPRRSAPVDPGRLARLGRPAISRLNRAVQPLLPRNRRRTVHLADRQPVHPADRITFPESRQRREPRTLEILHGIHRPRRRRGHRCPRATERQRRSERHRTESGHPPNAQSIHGHSLRSWAFGPGERQHERNPPLYRHGRH